MHAFGARPFAGLLTIATLLGITSSASSAPRGELVTTSVTSLTLIDADTGNAIADPFTGGTLDLAALPTRNLGIRANTSPSTVGSVKFGLDQNATYQIDDTAPYSLSGNTANNGYVPWTPSVGTHTVTATPFAKRAAAGRKGAALTVVMTVVDSGQPQPPEPTEPTDPPEPPSPGTLVDAPPIVIDGQSGVTVRGVRISSSSGRCVTVRNSSNIVIEDSEIGPCAGNAVDISNSQNITVANSYIHTERSGSTTMNSGLGVHIYLSSNVLVQGNRFERNETSVYGYQTGHSVRVIGNYSLNPLGPFPRGQHVQIWTCNRDGPLERGCVVSSNYGRLDPERGSSLGATNTEDMISVGKSNYALVEDNYLIGGDSASGCGLIVEGPASYTTFRNNVVIRTAQCGIGVYNSNHTLVESNRVLDTNLVSLGLTSGNVGIYVWRKSDSTDHCYNNTVQRNIVSNRFPDGTYNDIYLSTRCTNTVKLDNITGSSARSLLTPEEEKLPPPPIPSVP